MFGKRGEGDDRQNTNEENGETKETPRELYDLERSEDVPEGMGRIGNEKNGKKCEKEK